MSEMQQAYSPRVGLMERWYARNGGVLLSPLWLVLAFGLALPMFNHVGWVLGVVGLSGIAVGAVLGGADRSSGSEEFAMALAPSRREQYWFRLLAGGSVPLAAILGTCMVRYDVSAWFWGLFASSGWTVAMGERSSDAHVIAAILIPTACLAVSYAGAALGGVASGLLAALTIPIAAGICAMVETRLWGEPRGNIILSTIAVIGAGALVGGYPLYLRRDVASAGRRNQSAAIAVAVSILLLLGVFLLLFGVRSTEYQRVEHARAESVQPEAHRAMAGDDGPVASVQQVDLSAKEGGAQ
jgi:hypothetical protein